MGLNNSSKYKIWTNNKNFIWKNIYITTQGKY